MKQTLPFKTVAGCDILADMYGPLGGAIRPVVVWLHGGALITGDRGAIPPEQVEFYLGVGYRLIALDHRLAPETKLPAIIEDVTDGLAWVSENAAALSADADRLAVVGHSAGGYLALMAGVRARPRPRALVAFYGYGDILGEWYTRPAAFYCAQPPIPAEEAYATVGARPISAAPGPSNRARFYVYCRQHGLWPREVSGFDPATDPASLIPYCPRRHVDADYPPTLLLHGDQDTDVPCEESLAMARELAHCGVSHELIILPGAEHGFDLRGPADAVTGYAFDRVKAFLGRYLS